MESTTKTNKIEKISSNLPTVVLFGRTNVGKSTLFNKITEQGHAMTSKQAGTTRDSNQSIAEWQGKQFNLIDTGGVMETSFLRGKSKLKKLKIDKSDIDTQVQLQIKDYLKQADLIVFMVDARNGLLEQDREMALALKKLFAEKKKIILAVNKVDTNRQRNKLAEFYQLALGDPLPVSATTGSGTGDLLDNIVKLIKSPRSKTTKDESTEPIDIIFLGRPNAGKSSLLNAIIGEEKVIVNEAAHTTREPQDFSVSYNNKILRFIDTAGIIRAKSKLTKQEFIKLGMSKSLGALKKSAVALLVLDINEGIAHQDTKLVSEILDREVSVIVVANKWDKISEKNTKQYLNYISAKLPFLSWAPIIFLSAKHKTKTKQLLDLILQVDTARHTEFTEEELQEFLRSAARHSKPLTDTKVRGIIKRTPPKMKLKKLIQVRSNPLEFNLYIQSKFGLRSNYLRYLENRFREKFELIGTPIRINVKDNRDRPKTLVSSSISE